VSNHVPDDTIFRALATCPECIKQGKDQNTDDLASLRARVERLEAVRVAAEELQECFVIMNDEGWWRPNPDKTMHQRDNAIDKLAAALDACDE